MFSPTSVESYASLHSRLGLPLHSLYPISPLVFSFQSMSSCFSFSPLSDFLPSQSAISSSAPLIAQSLAMVRDPFSLQRRFYLRYDVSAAKWGDDDRCPLLSPFIFFSLLSLPLPSLLFSLISDLTSPNLHLATVVDLQHPPSQSNDLSIHSLPSLLSFLISELRDGDTMSLYGRETDGTVKEVRSFSSLFLLMMSVVAYIPLSSSSLCPPRPRFLSSLPTSISPCQSLLRPLHSLSLPLGTTYGS